MRLIDADALKEEFEATPYNDYDDLLRTERLIDNAPTVPLPDFKAGYKQAIIDGKTNFQRPHGEWIDICTLPIIRKCSICGNKIGNEMGFYNNFCPNCGARMKGGAE